MLKSFVEKRQGAVVLHMSYVDLAGHSGGDQRQAVILQPLDGRANLGDEGVDFGMCQPF